MVKEILSIYLQNIKSQNLKILTHEIIGYWICIIGTMFIIKILSKLPYTSEGDMFMLLLLLMFIFIGTLFIDNAKNKRKKLC